MPPENGANQMDERDLVRLRHMLDAARQALDFCANRCREDLDTNPMLRRAVIHCIQEIGEAAAQVSDECRAHFPSLPWQQIVGMRHRLVHVYFAINLDLVWEVVVKDLGVLASALEEALSPP